MKNLFASIVFLLSSARAQFVPAPTDLVTKTGFANVSVRYKEVPSGICELDPNVKSFSGYADVGPGQHVFFWFFEARNVDPTTAPLTVWINGGPGSSSMLGLFQEVSTVFARNQPDLRGLIGELTCPQLGPCRIDSNYRVHNNRFSWSNTSNLLFVDQPNTVGFSYSEPVSGYIDSNSGLSVTLPTASCPDYAEAFGTCGTYSYSNISLVPNTTANAAPSFWSTLQGFMGAFPQYSRGDFTFATESYGGHYGPVFNE